MPRKRIPFVGSLITRNTDPLNFTGKDQLFENCYPEVVQNPVTGDSRVYLTKRPGAASTAITGVLNGLWGGCVWYGNSTNALSYLVSGGASTAVYQGTGTQIGGNIANTNDCYELTETTISGTANLVGIFVDDSTAALEAWYFPVGGSWTQITDTDFPPNQTPALTLAGAPAHMDGFMFVMCTNGEIWNSDLNSVANWTAGNKITAQTSPDGGIGLARYKSYIVAFGTNSIEFFKNNGNASGSPLIRAADAILIGGVTSGLNARSIMPVGDTVYFVGKESGSARRGIYRLNGLQPQKVSTPAIDKIVNSTIDIGIVGSFTTHGMTHVMFTRGNSQMYCYCVDMNLWWSFVQGGSRVIRSIVGGFAVPIAYYSAATGAKVHQMGPTSPVFTDDSTAFTMKVRTMPLDFGTDLTKFWNELRVAGDRQSSTSNLGVAYSDDDYANFSTAENIDLSSAQPWRLGPHGASTRRAWQFTHSANTPCRLEAFELAFDVEQDTAG